MAARAVGFSCCYTMHIQGSGPFNLGSVANNAQLCVRHLSAALVTVLQQKGSKHPSDLFLSCMLTSSRHLSEEGIAELKGSAERITASDVIRIALNVSFSSENWSFPQVPNDGTVRFLFLHWLFVVRVHLFIVYSTVPIKVGISDTLDFVSFINFHTLVSILHYSLKTSSFYAKFNNAIIYFRFLFHWQFKLHPPFK